MNGRRLKRNGIHPKFRENTGLMRGNSIHSIKEKFEYLDDYEEPVTKYP